MQYFLNSHCQCVFVGWWQFDVKHGLYSFLALSVSLCRALWIEHIIWSGGVYENRNAEKSIPIYLVENFQEKYQRYQLPPLVMPLQTENFVWPIAASYSMLLRLFSFFFSRFRSPLLTYTFCPCEATASIAQIVFAFGTYTHTKMCWTVLCWTIETEPNRWLDSVFFFALSILWLPIHLSLFPFPCQLMEQPKNFLFLVIAFCHGKLPMWKVRLVCGLFRLYI